MGKQVYRDIKRKSCELIENIADQGIEQGNNLEYLGELIDICKDIAEIEHYEDMKEGEDMRYGHYDYDRRDRDDYGARRRDSRGRYRGHDYLDEMYDYYGRYMEGRDRYGADEETDKSFHYMVKALEDFIHVLHEEAETQQQKQMLKDTLQNAMR